MKKYFYTDYFENKVLKKRPYLQKNWCVQVVENPIQREDQPEDQRIRFWGIIDEMGGRFLRVVTLEDSVTIHNAFFDRRFKI